MKMNSTQRHRTERAMIDALLKISEIVKKTERSRNQSKQRTKRSIGDGDKIDFLTPCGQVPMPPPMRTLDSFVSTFNHQQTQQPSNFNRAPVVKPLATGKRTHQNESDDCSSSSSTSSSSMENKKKKSTSVREEFSGISFDLCILIFLCFRSVRILIRSNIQVQ